VSSNHLPALFTLHIADILNELFTRMMGGDQASHAKQVLRERVQTGE
jgi:hypothetical protein